MPQRNDQHRWKYLTLFNSDSVEVKWFRDWTSWNMMDEKDFEVVFTCHDTALKVSSEIFDNATRLLDKYGMAGYKEKWGEHDFPIDGYNRLKTLLKK